MGTWWDGEGAGGLSAQSEGSVSVCRLGEELGDGRSGLCNNSSSGSSFLRLQFLVVDPDSVELGDPGAAYK